ncbi:MAG: hypothetical protein ACRDYX_19910 [Egibacteraceae bacterium]
MLIVFRHEQRVDARLACQGRVASPRPERCPVCGHGWVTFDGWWPRAARRGPVAVSSGALRQP